MHAGYQEWFNFPVGSFVTFPPGGDVTFGNFKSTSFWHKMIYLNELVIEVYGMTGAFIGDRDLHHRTMLPCVMTDPPHIEQFPAVSEHMKIWEQDPFEQLHLQLFLEPPEHREKRLQIGLSWSWNHQYMGKHGTELAAQLLGRPKHEGFINNKGSSTTRSGCPPSAWRMSTPLG